LATHTNAIVINRPSEQNEVRMVNWNSQIETGSGHFVGVIFAFRNTRINPQMAVAKLPFRKRFAPRLIIRTKQERSLHESLVWVDT
jgi:hypothetical protein